MNLRTIILLRLDRVYFKITIRCGKFTSTSTGGTYPIFGVTTTAKTQQSYNHFVEFTDLGEFGL